MGKLRDLATGHQWKKISNEARIVMLDEDARIEALEARIAKADALAVQVQRVKDFRYDPNIGIELNRLEEQLAAYREADT